MYGLVNRAVEELISGRFGEPAWEVIKQRAGVVDDFLSNQVYDDAVTFSMIGAASDVLGVDAEQLIEDLGEHWIRYTAQEGFGPLLDAAGDNLPQFLRNIGTIHARVRVAMPDARLPSFRCLEAGPGTLRLEYRCARPGFVALVRGILKGLAYRFGVTLDVVHVERKSDGAELDVFMLHCVPKGSPTNEEP